MNFNLQNIFPTVFDFATRVVNKIDNMYIFGDFSFLDFFIYIAIAEIVISAFVITFRQNKRKQQYEKNKRSSNSNNGNN